MKILLFLFLPFSPLGVMICTYVSIDVHSPSPVCLHSSFFLPFFCTLEETNRRHISLHGVACVFQWDPYIRHRILFLHSTILSLDFCQRRSFFFTCVGVWCECWLLSNHHHEPSFFSLFLSHQCVHWFFEDEKKLTFEIFTKKKDFQSIHGWRW